ncbi:hypothetical protein SAMN05660337_1571 [Maridesulfovibrio ferrireducens]|uniref:Homeodomain-like domain-containing protein n=1 Tax=Maridesulfovibrio ferrireducens TaxID=246191 RepID=A0A1G9FJG2_9BACT|nr:hypothetical protein [Maridesulfovibrio ferrireducens]SDK88568.1 hypothetical protein SAMN05660337_1571 [Maridesulfovibrio ferrireducens]
MKENLLYEAMVREMDSVRLGNKSPEKAALSVLKEFSNDRVYISTRFVEHAKLTEKVIKLKNYGIENADIADRLGITQRHVRRIYSSMNN